jgi:aspartate oxidase
VPSWDDEADVVIVGFGGAGGNAAISAHDSGARVLIIEKMPSAGGNSTVSGAGLFVPDNVPDAIRYYRALSSGTVDEDLIRVFAEAMVGIPDLLKKLGIEFTVKKAIPQFPSLPGSSSISKRIQFKPPGSGEVKFKALLNLVEKRRIRVIFNTSAKALIQIPG